jgi:hypothetical protein
MSSLLPVAAVQTPEARERLLGALLARASAHGVTVEHSTDADRHGGAAYRQEGRKILLSGTGVHTDQEVSNLAHELGHAELDESALGRLVQDPILRSAAYWAPGVGGLIAATSSGGLVRRAALSAGAVAAMQLPMLGSEMLADRRGRKILEEHGASDAILATHQRESSSGVKSYLRPGVTGVTIALLISALAHSMSKV